MEEHINPSVIVEQAMVPAMKTVGEYYKQNDADIPKICLLYTSTMHQDIARKGELASDLLFRLLSGEKVAEKAIHLPVELVVRKSVLPPD